MGFNAKYLPVIFPARHSTVRTRNISRLLFDFNYPPSSAYGGEKSSSEPKNIRDLKYMQFTLLVSLLKIDRYCNIFLHNIFTCRGTLPRKMVQTLMRAPTQFCSSLFYGPPLGFHLLSFPRYRARQTCRVLRLERVVLARDASILIARLLTCAHWTRRTRYD